MRDLRWANLAVFPLVLGLSILPLLWFGRNWVVTADSSFYLLLGWNLISGEGYTALGGFEFQRGPVFPGLLGGLMLLYGRNIESLAWVVRLLELANPVLMYFLIKRIAGPIAGLLAAALVALFSITTTLGYAVYLDAFRLTLFLLAVLVLLVAAQRDSARLSLLSGLLLGVAILTKETSFAAFPLAFFTALLLGWSLRGVLLHYAGVLVVCLPWWWWIGLGEFRAVVFHLGGLPSGLVILVIAALALIALFVVGSYRSGIVARLLTDERRRQRIGWSVVLTSTAVLSVLALSIGHTFSDISDSGETIPMYIVGRLRAAINLWYLLPFAGVYVLWETVWGNRLWGFYLTLLILQIPVSLLMLVERSDTRLWLIIQTLLYGALAGLMAKVLGVLIHKDRLSLRRSLAFGAATVLIAVLVGAAVSQVRYLLFNDTSIWDANSNNVNVQNHQSNEYNPAVRNMHNWIAENVAEGEKIVTTKDYADQLAFLDGMQHDWILLETDCPTALGGRPSSASCPPTREIAQAPPRPTVWFKMDRNCNALALSLNTLIGQMKRSSATYLLTTQEMDSFYPSNLGWAPYLYGSGAFKIVHSSYLPNAAPTDKEAYGLLLLKRTDQNPTSASAPTQMDIDSVQHLIRCEQAAWGEEQYAERIRSIFPNGIEIMGGSHALRADEKEMIDALRTRLGG